MEERGRKEEKEGRNERRKDRTGGGEREAVRRRNNLSA
jgi:hypothetical protein